MNKISPFLPLIELFYFAYGMIFLHWSVSVTLFYLWLGLVIYYPFGFIYIALSDGKKMRAMMFHLLFYGMGLFIWTFILLIATGMIIQLEWQSSLDVMLSGIPIYVFIASSRYILALIMKRRSSVTEAFYIGIWKLLFMFAIMFPTVFVLTMFHGEVALISWIIIIVTFTFEIKKLGQHYSLEEIRKLGKQMKFI